ncbi:uncharacterized protein PHACADRAFT_210780 [Phanerochaete carnosa HHB-10118-sp]|uniref:Protein kinase domain-containing protein n=1 Tax=Phanerochaete carnosa (strain HHB-10118-sp) TaxID=650164 RepID=K5USX1_PHACS|nr:uncharacterized protein PHACADRAFT_210780 [Phanerochaete carnosa HHB-10118-sp]EKM53041.1 hypothetical protein PHACADRAFT_210780 [Phanerochaete carnosa HHB-10118-sp]
MSSDLTIKFSAIPQGEGEPGREEFSLHLTRVDKQVRLEGRLQIYNTVGVTASATREYYRGTLAQRSPNDPETDVFIKLAYAQNLDDAAGLRTEANFYNKQLKALQGDVVPVCYGIYEGEHDDGDPIVCLVLEYMGEPAEDGLGSLDMDVRLEVLRSVVQVHLAGVMHNDINDDNVLFSSTPDSKPRIIDFEHAEKHKCRRKLEIVEGAPVPERLLFGCPELWDLAANMGIWRSQYVCFYGEYVDEDTIDSPQVLIDAVRSMTFLPQEDIERRANKAYEMVQVFKENGGYRPRDFNPDDWVF